MTYMGSDCDTFGLYYFPRTYAAFHAGNPWKRPGRHILVNVWTPNTRSHGAHALHQGMLLNCGHPYSTTFCMSEVGLCPRHT